MSLGYFTLLAAEVPQTANEKMNETINHRRNIARRFLETSMLFMHIARDICKYAEAKKSGAIRPNFEQEATLITLDLLKLSEALRLSQKEVQEQCSEFGLPSLRLSEDFNFSPD